MTGLVATSLLVLAVLDGAFAGFRSSLGRTGLVRHRASDRLANLRGAALVGILLVPAIGLALMADGLGHLGGLRRAGTAMLVVYGPYAVLVLLALGCYALLDWRLRYLASALILGPFTLARPYVVVAGGVAAGCATADPWAWTCVVLAVAGVLVVEPLADRLWYRRGR